MPMIYRTGDAGVEMIKVLIAFKIALDSMDPGHDARFDGVSGCAVLDVRRTRL